MLESRNSRTFSKVALKIKYLGENDPTRTFAKSEPPFKYANVDVDVVTDIDIDINIDIAIAIASAIATDIDFFRITSRDWSMHVVTIRTDIDRLDCVRGYTHMICREIRTYLPARRMISQ